LEKVQEPTSVTCRRKRSGLTSSVTWPRSPTKHAVPHERTERTAALGTVLLTLFQILTLEGWVEIQQSVLATTPWAWLYFGSFIFVGVFVVVKLFIAVVISNLESVKHEQQATADRVGPHRALLQTIEELRARLEDMERQLRASPQAVTDAPEAPSASVWRPERCPSR
jgi:hypothetical protein